MKTIIQKQFAEALGTFILVFFGCGSAVFWADGIGAGLSLGIVGISFAFGIAIVAAAYSLGHISGAHLNPAVSLGVHLAGKMTVSELISYVIAQVVGAIAAALVIYIIASGTAGYEGGLGQNGYGAGYLGEYNVGSAFIFELVATFIFVTVILGATQAGAPATMAGLAIGLTLVMIHLTGINITGVSVNPARSIGPALFAGTEALADLWLFLVAPLLGGAGAGFVFRMGLTRAEDDKPS